MWPDSDTTRRRTLRLGGIAAAGGLAGCTGLLDGSTGGEQPTDEPETDEPETGEPETDEPPTEFTDDFGGRSLSAYRTVAGDRDQWDIEARIDGPSAHATASGSYANTLLAPQADQFRWTGTGQITLDVWARENNYNRNALVEFGDPDGDAWRVKVAFTGRKIKIRSPSEQVESVRATPEPGAAHQLDVSVTPDAVTVSLDGEQRAEFPDPPSLPAGTVAFGIGSNESKGGQTWFDDLRFRAE
ncbi:hypothetical protein ACOZ4N_16310 [Halorientalis pallida]|uniref:hypothetical protein n=1 Tax=Halorientalis pallida TaxID=2479928 RepID=UPI003C6EFA82